MSEEIEVAAEDVADALTGRWIGWAEVRKAEHMGNGLVSLTLTDGSHLNLTLRAADA